MNKKLLLYVLLTIFNLSVLLGAGINFIFDQYFSHSNFPPTGLKSIGPYILQFKLGLDDRQMEQIVAKRNNFLEYATDTNHSISEKRSVFFNRLNDPRFTVEDADAIMEEIGQQQLHMQKVMIRQLFAIKSIMNQEQKDKFIEMIRKKIDHNYHPLEN